MSKWKTFDFGPDAKTNKRAVPTVSTRKSFNFYSAIAPKCVTDLAVHPKKIKEVEDWLISSVINCNSHVNASFLLITGPTGSGKTATINVLCEKMRISIAEWVNPMDQDFEMIRGPNQISRFIEFLTETKYASLFENEVSKKITIVKDFPNAVVHNPEEFFRVLEECYYQSRTPIVFICTQSSSTGLNLSQKLFPDEIKLKYQIDEITFNSCATTLLKNAIKRALNIAQSNPDFFKTVSSSAVDAIIASSMGDIRSAINQFHLASLKGSHEMPTEQVKLEKAGTKRKRVEKLKKVKNMEKDELLGLFHGLGRVLNPKLTESGKINCNFEKLVDEFSTQPGIFTAFLFENYSQYFGDVNDAAGASEILSLSQCFLDKWYERYDNLCFGLWVSVMGLMIHNRHRVSKWTQIRGPKKITKWCSNDSKQYVSSTDGFYYNIINKCDKYPRFVCE